MTKILVLGASGMLGASLLDFFVDKPGIEAIGTVRSSDTAALLPAKLRQFLRIGIDVDHIEALISLLAHERPDVVINCIGIIKQRSEAKQELPSIRINALFPHLLAQYCDWFGARMLQISTDCVFSGSQSAAQVAEHGRYTEDSPTDAKDLYGRSKHMGEVHNQSHVLTLRTSIIGHELNSKRSLVDWFLSETGEVRGFTKAIFSGLPAVELARVILEYVVPDVSLTGLYHVAAEPIDKHRLLSLIAETYGHSIQIVPDSDLVIDRGLNGTRFMEATGYTPPDWVELIHRMHAYRHTAGQR